MEVLSESDSQLTGNAGLNWTLNESWAIYTEIGTGFRFPELTEKFYQGITGRGILSGEPNLEAETAFSQEVGMVFDSGSLRLQGSIFSSQIRNYIERLAVSDTTLSYENLRDGRLDGVELMASYQLDNWHFELNSHWIQGQDDQSNNLADVSPARVLLAVQYHADWGDLRLDYRHRFVSTRVHSSELPIERFNKLSLSYGFLLADKYSVKFWMNNALNDDYRLTADDLSPTSTARGVGASITLYK